MTGEIRTYTLRELQVYTGTTAYISQPFIPVSSLRTASYIMNPRASDKDVVLAEYYQEGQLVAYRTLLPDMFLTEKGEPQRFAWLSGNYVAPSHRRQGISTILFRAVEEAWDGRLMYTNYAPASKAVYDQTGKFRLYRSGQGFRFFLRSPFHAAFKIRTGAHGLLRSADAVIDFFHDPLLGLYKQKAGSRLILSEVRELPPDFIGFIEKQQQGSLFGRDVPVFNWIVRFPWVREGDSEGEGMHYNFSLVSDLFFNKWYILRKEDGTAAGFIWIMVNGRKLSVPYFLAPSDTEEDVARVAASLLVNTMISHKLVYCTIHNRTLGKAVIDQRAPFIFRKQSPMNYYVHERLFASVPENAIIRDGDGDCVFT